MVPPTRPVPRPRMVTGFLALLVAFVEQAFFGEAALLPKRVQLHRVELGSLGGELLLEMTGEREVHVVAAQQDVLADGHAVELQFAVTIR